MGRMGTFAAWLALFTLLAMGTAQGLSGSNTVFSDDIVDGQVTTPDLQSGAVTSGKVLDGSLKGKDIAASSVGLSKLGGTWTAEFRGDIQANVTGYAYAPCPSGQTAISGSGRGASAGLSMLTSEPLSDGWIVTYRNWYAAPSYVDVRALCVLK